MISPEGIRKRTMARIHQAMVFGPSRRGGECFDDEHRPHREQRHVDHARHAAALPPPPATPTVSSACGGTICADIGFSPSLPGGAVRCLRSECGSYARCGRAVPAELAQVILHPLVVEASCSCVGRLTRGEVSHTSIPFSVSIGSPPDRGGARLWPVDHLVGHLTPREAGRQCMNFACSGARAISVLLTCSAT